MNYPYSAPCSYFLIYVYEIPGSVDHAGFLKVGDTSLKDAGRLTFAAAKLGAEMISGLLESIQKATRERRFYVKGKVAK